MECKSIQPHPDIIIMPEDEYQALAAKYDTPEMIVYPWPFIDSWQLLDGRRLCLKRQDWLFGKGLRDE